jgi:hypothetical protein
MPVSSKGVGTADASEVRTVMANLGERFEMHEVEELMRVPEIDADGQISYEGGFSRRGVVRCGAARLACLSPVCVWCNPPPLPHPLAPPFRHDSDLVRFAKENK